MAFFFIVRNSYLQVVFITGLEKSKNVLAAINKNDTILHMIGRYKEKETEEYLQYLNVKLSKYDVVQAYMVTGGIPYYLSYFKKGNSLPQCVDDLFFSKNAKLKNEFERHFYSAFTNPEMMLSIIRALNTRNSGYTR